MVLDRNFTQFIHVHIFLKGGFFIIFRVFVVCPLKLLLNQEKFLNITKFCILTVVNKESVTFTWAQDGLFSWNLLFIF